MCTDETAVRQCDIGLYDLHHGTTPEILVSYT